MDALATTLQDLLDRRTPAIIVRIAAGEGSTPRDAGTAMLVTGDACHGTIGGGRLEWLAVERARTMLADGDRQSTLDLALGPSVGQCCGGHVVLQLRRADAESLVALARTEAQAQQAQPPVWLFGAGHVGQALARALAPLPLALTVIDDRRDFLARLPAAAVRLPSAAPASEVAAAPPGTAFAVMTHSHALDYEITGAALSRGDACYVGLIGSATKRTRFVRWYAARGGSDAALAGLTCPIGIGGPRDKRPSVIAALVAAEIATQALAGPNAVQETMPMVAGGARP